MVLLKCVKCEGILKACFFFRSENAIIVADGKCNCGLTSNYLGGILSRFGCILCVYFLRLPNGIVFFLSNIFVDAPVTCVGAYTSWI